jgi:hypothetical protein
MSELGSSRRTVQVEASTIGSAIVSGDGNSITIIHQATAAPVAAPPTPEIPEPGAIGPNPYQGLAAFQEQDADRYFGREAQVERLWQRFQSLYEQTALPRFLPVLGPSGSGKSSLVRAGFIPELARRPLPGKTQLRVAVLVPGTRPVEALAGVLAKAATEDPLPVEKTAEFERVLKQPNEDGIYDGLRRIAALIPNIRAQPLVILVDQFEEVYSLCKDAEQRRVFIHGLLEAAHDPSGDVSVVITLRSDFIGETQRDAALNQVIGSDQSLLLPAMTVAELRRAISEPAKQAGQPLEAAIIEFLISDTKEREGALPLLQFALTRVWEGLNEGQAPADTYREMGGVGGALAGNAQKIYEKLDNTEKEIARRFFVGLVQLGEGTQDTRRRVAITNLIASRDKPDVVRQVISRFSSPGVRLVTLSTQDGKEIAEVTHEALFDHWEQFKHWLDDSRSDLHFYRRVEAASTDWDETGRPEGKLWRPPDLDLLRRYYDDRSNSLTFLQKEFSTASIHAFESLELKKRKQKSLLATVVSAGVTAIVVVGTFAWQQWQDRQINELLALATGDIVKPEFLPVARKLLTKADRLSQSVQPNDINTALSYYRAVIGFSQALYTNTSLDNSSGLNSLLTDAETGLVELIMERNFNVLESQLTSKPPQIGDRTGADITDFENQFSEGALQTTYNLLRRHEGAKADIDDNGQITSHREAERMPCKLLEIIEETWRKHTSNTCGWYSREENHAFLDLTCDALGGETLAAKVFNDPYDASIERLKVCNLIPRDVELDYPFQDFYR